MRIILLIISFHFCFTTALFSQSEQSDFDFLYKVIQRSYPGFNTKIDSVSYVRFAASLKKQSEKNEFEKMSELVLFFNDKHLVVYDVEPKKRFDSIYCKKNYEKALAYLNNKKLKKDRYEGYWLNDFNDCIMGVVKSSDKPVAYTGMIMDVKSESDLPKGFPICIMHSPKDGVYLTQYTYPIYDIKSWFLYSKFTNANTLVTGSYNRWKKVSPLEFKNIALSSLPEYNYDPSFKVFDSTTAVITLPAMDGYYASVVDSLVKANDSIIRRTPNLIIDVRNNFGGTSRTYFPLLPYIYTNPISRQSIKTYYSEDYIQYTQRTIERIRKSKDTVGLKAREDGLVKSSVNKNKFIFDTSAIVKFDSVLIYPKNVAVLINYACMSATELMLLDFMQSKKVKFFGETTGGAVDYLSFFPIKTPSKRYTIYMPSVIRQGSGEKFSAIDSKGILPDVFIDGKINNWIEFVKNYYEGKKKFK